MRDELSRKEITAMLFESHVTGVIEGLKIATDYLDAWSLNNAPSSDVVAFIEQAKTAYASASATLETARRKARCSMRLKPRRVRVSHILRDQTIPERPAVGMAKARGHSPKASSAGR